MEGFPSGQREQTVNLSSMTSVVRIHHLPPKQKDIPKGMSFFCFGGRWLWIRKVALRNSPVGCFNHRGFAAAKRIHHWTGRHACGSATMGGNSQSRQAHALNGAPALRNSPVGCFNHRGFRRNGSESTTGRVGRRVAVRPRAAIANPGRHTPNPKERQVSTRPIRRKERSFNDEIYQHGPFVTIYCHLRRYPVGAHSVRPGSAKSYGSWANAPTR